MVRAFFPKTSDQTSMKITQNSNHSYQYPNHISIMSFGLRCDWMANDQEMTRKMLQQLQLNSTLRPILWPRASDTLKAKTRISKIQASMELAKTVFETQMVYKQNVHENLNLYGVCILEKLRDLWASYKVLKDRILVNGEGLVFEKDLLCLPSLTVLSTYSRLELDIDDSLTGSFIHCRDNALLSGPL